MFKVIIQRQTKKGYETLKSVTLSTFSETVAEKAMSLTDDTTRCSMYIAHSDSVPEGYASRKLEFTTSIWKQVEVSPEEALDLLSTPF